MKVALVGDSHAGHWAPAVREIAKREGWSLTTYIRSACPITTVAASGFDSWDDACIKWNDAATASIDHGGYDLVIASAASYTKFLPGTAGDATAEAVQGYSTAWKGFEATGAQVAVIRDNPTPTTAGIPDIDSCVVTHETDLAACTIPRPALDADVQVPAAAKAGASLIDMTNYFCDAKSCPPVIGGVLVYQDLTHLTKTYAKTLAPYLKERLDAAMRS